MISEQLVDFCHGPLIAYFATCDAKLRPHTLNAVGVRVDGPAGRITVFLPKVVADRPLANIQAQPKVSLTVIFAPKHESYQFKGRALEVRDATDAETGLQEVFLTKAINSIEAVGLPTDFVRRVVPTPSHAVTFEVSDIFLQTPGPGAGSRIGP